MPRLVLEVISEIYDSLAIKPYFQGEISGIAIRVLSLSILQQIDDFNRVENLDCKIFSTRNCSIGYRSYPGSSPMCNR